MPEENPFRPPTSNDPNSLANLLPEYFEDYPADPKAAPTIPPAVNGNPPQPYMPMPYVPMAVPVRKTPVKAKSREGNFNYVVLALVAVVCVVILPLLVFGVFFLIANTQPAQTTINVGQATTPLVTVYSITPGAANSTTAPTAKAAAGANATSGNAPAAASCPVQNAFGQVAYYSCAKLLQAGSAFTGYFGLAELQLAQNGQNGPSGNRVFAASADSPAKVLNFYATLLPAQGYALSGATSNGTTPLGNYSVALYSKNGQQLQIVALTVNKASPDGQINAGQTLIRLSSS